MVEIPGRTTFSQEIFNQMHYGVSASVAALCVLQLAALTLLAAALLAISRQRR